MSTVTKGTTKRRNIVLTGESARWLQGIRDRFSAEVGFRLSYSQTMEVLSQRIEQLDTGAPVTAPTRRQPRSTVAA